MTSLYKGKAFQLAEENEIGLLTFDTEGARVNTLDHASIGELVEILTDFEKKFPQIKALLLYSGKKDSFIVGADLNLVRSMNDRAEAEKASRSGQDAFNMMADLNIPSVAAIHGACMGGGTELSVACSYRLCSDSSKTMIAVPEVKLGFLPGWGGTYRLPKIVGLASSLDMMLTGKNIRSDKAGKLSLVSKVIPEAIFLDEAKRLTQDLAAGRNSLKIQKKPLLQKLSKDPSSALEGFGLGRSVVFSQAGKTVMKQTRGNYPAPLRILEVVQKSWGKSREKALDLEAKGFADLWATPESKNLVGLFFLNEGAKKDTGVSLSSEEVKKLPRLNEIAVLGAGVMGGGIASQSAAKGMRTLVKDINWPSVQKAISHANELADKALQRKRIDKVAKKDWMSRIRGQVDYSGFKSVDLVVEAVVENMEIKKSVFKEVEEHVGPDCVIASNTSSLRITEMATVFKDPSRLVGLHYFNPVDKMPLVEVVSHDQASEKAIAQAVQYVKDIGKTPVVVKDGPGFLVNRILMPWLNEAGYCLLEGYEIAAMDKHLKKFGMPMGPFELLDEIGLDVAEKVAKILYQGLGERSQPSDAISKVLSKNEGAEKPRLGRKSGLGFYTWDRPGGRRVEVDKAGIEDLIFENGEAPTTPEYTPESLSRRHIFPMINEAAAILEEGLTAGPEQVDLAMIFGTGFAPFRGGLCRYADSVGLERVVAELDRLSEQHGPRLAPSDALRNFAKNGGKFYRD